MNYNPSHFKTFILLILMVCSFSSCRKKLKGEYLLYEGTWTNGTLYSLPTGFNQNSTGFTYEKEWVDGTTTITIEESGKASYYYYVSSFGASEEKTIDGKVKFKGDQMIIKFSFIKEEFTINQSPTSDGYGKFMVLDNDTFRLSE